MLFDSHFARLKAEISTARAVLITNDRLRSLVAMGIIDRVGVEDDSPYDFRAIAAGAPAPTSWRVSDHCATVTRVYAVYEQFVVTTIKQWLAYFPSLWPSYLDIPESIRAANRFGIGRLLHTPRARYAHISETRIVEGLYNGLTGGAPYALLPEAFVATDQNLRSTVLTELFSKVGIQNAWNWISMHPTVTSFISEVRGSQNTPDAELNSFIGYRNEAAHGAVDSVLGTESLLGLADFVLALCTAICELVRGTLVRHSIERGIAQDLGRVTEKFRNGAVVVRMNRCTLGVGDVVLLHSDNRCYVGKILSIQLDGVPSQSVSAADGDEVGLLFDVAVMARPRLVRLNFAAAQAVP
jgi:hypothetical protein